MVGAGVNLGLCNSMDMIMSEIVLAWTSAALPVRLGTKTKQDL